MRVVAKATQPGASGRLCPLGRTLQQGDPPLACPLSAAGRDWMAVCLLYSMDCLDKKKAGKQGNNMIYMVIIIDYSIIMIAIGRPWSESLEELTTV